MAEELAVEGGRDDRVGAGAAGRERELVPNTPRGGRRVRADALGGGLDVVLVLRPEVGLRVGHAPVAQAGPVVLAVELPVRAVAGIAELGGPHLPGDLGIARDGSDAGPSDEVRPEDVHARRRGRDRRRRDRGPGPGGWARERAERPSTGRDLRAGEQRRVREEVIDAVLLE